MRETYYSPTCRWSLRTPWWAWLLIALHLATLSAVWGLERAPMLLGL